MGNPKGNAPTPLQEVPADAGEIPDIETKSTLGAYGAKAEGEPGSGCGRVPGIEIFAETCVSPESEGRNSLWYRRPGPDRADIRGNQRFALLLPVQDFGNAGFCSGAVLSGRGAYDQGACQDDPRPGFRIPFIKEPEHPQPDPKISQLINL